MKVFLYNRPDENSRKIAAELSEKLAAAGHKVLKKFSPAADYSICVGGDGTLLNYLFENGYPSTPVAGVNTGHLGFFLEFDQDGLDELIAILASGDFVTQRQPLLKACVNGSEEFLALNDVTIKGDKSSIIHLNLKIGQGFIEKFSGDGILVSTSAGSTAYNYSLGGSIVDPRVRALQLTPMAPVNSKAYRCFGTSLLLPPDMEINVIPDPEFERSAVISCDGKDRVFETVESVVISYADAEVRLIRLRDYDFWSKVESKFL